MQVEQQIVVERAGGRAVAALHVVGENLELGLAVGLGLVRQQQRMRRHHGVGLLRLRLHDDLALEHAAAFAVEHGLEHLAADAGAGCVIDDQRASACWRPFSSVAPRMPATVPSPWKWTNSWLRTTDAAGGEQEFVETRMRADRCHQARDMQRSRALAGDLDVVDMGLVADRDFERGVDLIVATRRAFVALDQHRPRALADHARANA